MALGAYGMNVREHTVKGETGKTGCRIGADDEEV